MPIKPLYSLEPEARPEKLPPFPEAVHYVDNKGDTICHSLMEYSFESFPAQAGDVRYELKRLEKFDLLDESGEQIDVLKEAKEMGVRILIGDKRAYTYKYDPESDTVLSPPLETPTDVSILLHEINHAKQWKDPTWRKLLELRKALSEIGPRREEKAEELLGLMLDVWQATPDLQKTIPHDALQQIIDQFNELKGRVEEAETKLEKLKSEQIEAVRGEMTAGSAGNERADELNSRIREATEKVAAAKKARSLLLDSADFMGQILAVPQKLTEINATEGAVETLATWHNQSGINMLAEHELPPDPIIGVTFSEEMATCASSMKAATSAGEKEAIVRPTADVIEVYRRLLETYDAVTRNGLPEKVE